MASESKSFSTVLPFPQTRTQITAVRAWALWLQIGVVYVLMVSASWTPQGRWKLGLMLTAVVIVGCFTLCSRYTAREMGLGIPSLPEATMILGLGLLLGACIPAVAVFTGLRFPPIRIVPWRGAWQYAVWALMQQFALQSFFYLRMESLLGSRRAMLAAAVLFSSMHLPSPVLTVATLVGGLFFCEMFRRYRTIVPLGLVHALLGLTIAASFSDHLLHHMRVGVGYLAFHR